MFSNLIKEHCVERHALLCAKLLKFAPKEVLNGFVGHVLTVGTNPALTSMSFGKVMFKKQFTAYKRMNERQVNVCRKVRHKHQPLFRKVLDLFFYTILLSISIVHTKHELNSLL